MNAIELTYDAEKGGESLAKSLQEALCSKFLCIGLSKPEGTTTKVEFQFSSYHEETQAVHYLKHLGYEVKEPTTGRFIIEPEHGENEIRLLPLLEGSPMEAHVTKERLEELVSSGKVNINDYFRLATKEKNQRSLDASYYVMGKIYFGAIQIAR